MQRPLCSSPLSVQFPCGQPISGASGYRVKDYLKRKPHTGDDDADVLSTGGRRSRARRVASPTAAGLQQRGEGHEGAVRRSPGFHLDLRLISSTSSARSRPLALVRFQVLNTSRTAAGPGSGKPRPTRTQPGGLRALSPLTRRSARPLSERQRDGHCGFAYFVGEHAILDRARQHHSANA
jgi:hypothetical protein